MFLPEKKALLTFLLHTENSSCLHFYIESKKKKPDYHFIKGHKLKKGMFFVVILHFCRCLHHRLDGSWWVGDTKVVHRHFLHRWPTYLQAFTVVHLLEPWSIALRPGLDGDKSKLIQWNAIWHEAGGEPANKNLLWKHFKNLGGGLLLTEIPLKTAWTSDKNLSKELYMLQCGQLNMHFNRFNTFLTGPHTFSGLFECWGLGLRVNVRIRLK